MAQDLCKETLCGKRSRKGQGTLPLAYWTTFITVSKIYKLNASSTNMVCIGVLMEDIGSLQ